MQQQSEFGNGTDRVCTPLPVLPVEPVDKQPARWFWRQELFAVPAGPAYAGEVIAWWQTRRWIYNKLVFGLGVPSFFLYLFFLLTSGQLPPGEDAVEPMALILSPILVPLIVNLCYSLGPVTELVWRVVSGRKTREAGSLLMALGVGFSLFVIFFPTLIWGAVWLWHLGPSR